MTKIADFSDTLAFEVNSAGNADQIIRNSTLLALTFPFLEAGLATPTGFSRERTLFLSFV